MIRLLEREINGRSFETDGEGRVLRASQDFLQAFEVREKDVVGKVLSSFVQTSDKDSIHELRKDVFAANILGCCCFIRRIPNGNLFVYDVLIRQDEIRPSDLAYFRQTFNNQRSRKKNSKSVKYSFEELIGESPAFTRLKELAARIASSSSTVLLTGESGTGKEVFAQAIHGLSTRKSSPFVAVNCAAIPDELFESEIFGYEAGAFSGAKKEGKPGKIELAQNGTLFLDEITELSYQAQGKLLRVLQEREIERLGSVGTKMVDIRIIAATNKDIRNLVDKGKFRQDLYYRLYVFELKLPPLRNRREDILPLARYFIEMYNRDRGCGIQEIETQLQNWLCQYNWPGNVRELKALIERGMTISEGSVLTLDSLHVDLSDADEHPNENYDCFGSLEEAVQYAEKTAIQRALSDSDGDRTIAAQKLKIHLASLYRKISKYQLK